MTLVGAYVGNGSTESPVAETVSDYEDWLNRHLDLVALHTGANGWGDWVGSVGWQVYNHRDVIPTHDIHWSIPLIPNWGASMAEAAAGAYSQKYIDAAESILFGTPGTDVIYIRTGWEFNATWAPVSSNAVGQAENYVGAYRDFVDSFRSVSDRFIFEWTPNVGNHGMNPEDGYPGDDYVDVIGMDFYWDSQQWWSTQDPVQAWNYMVNQQYGLQWLEDFAAAHGKPTAYSEWGVNSNNAAYYIEQVYKWFEDHNVLYQNYWESNAAFSGLLHQGQYPQTAQAFLDLFGIDPVDPVPVPPEEPLATPPPAPDLHDIIAEQENTDVTIRKTNAVEMIIGHEKNHMIDGGGGADILRGGAGDDRYMFYGTEKIMEYAGEGKDAVLSKAVSTTLMDNIEYLYLIAGTGQTGIGNNGDNWIEGGIGDDVIAGMGGRDIVIGGGGNDILYGGTEADIFVFHANDTGTDIIRDFSVAEGDRLDLRDFLSGYDPVSEAITDFIQVTNDGTHSYLFVDSTGSGQSWTHIVTIEKITSLGDETALVNAGIIIV